MNWGKGLAIAMGTFVVFIAVLVTILMSHRIDLESDDYYQRELAYGDEIKAEQNVLKYGEKIELKLMDDHILVSQTNDTSVEDVKVIFSRPDDRKGDLEFELKKDQVMMLPRSSFKKGLYNVEIVYRDQERDYLQHEQIYN